ncbi:site-specific integrase [Enterocloster asparagiformis]|uniref:site-specific integrase n=1 Tax=Enterocloster asparagiformis TaxID=333367 RepID=UPI002A7FCA6A|nr:site-specific integrase [Enterocloster asparagiformis]
MPAYKDEKRNTWYCQFYYKNWRGESKQKRKRGFSTKKAAKAWEQDFLNSLAKGSDIMFPVLVENYMDDLSTRLKPTTMETKRSIFETKITPYFMNFKVYEIDALAVRLWQNELLKYRDEKGNPYSDTYLRSINNQLSAILNYATVYYHLQNNPCKQTGSIGKSDADAMQIWTLDQFERFIEYEDKAAGRLAFDIFFWTGIREGELLALTIEDFTFNGVDEYHLNINKNFEVVRGTQYLLTPKTDSSNRCIMIPQFLYNEAIEYFAALYEPSPKERLFYFTKSYLLKEIKRVAHMAGLEPIRVHDLRHSHASLLIEMGFNILMVSQRLGHEKVETTWRTYAHLYPDKERILATKLDTVKIHGIAGNLSVEEQLLKFMQQFQKHLNQQPAIIDISNEEIYRWNPETKEKALVSQEEFEYEAELDENIEAALAVAEIFQAGYLEICGMIYCLASRGLPIKYL